MNTLQYCCSRYDCRKTPSDGIPETDPTASASTTNESKAQNAASSSDNVNSSQPNTSDISLENVETPPNRPNSGLGYPTMDESWCYNCDVKHEDTKDCPYANPVSICIDSVIDFSANDRDDSR